VAPRAPDPGISQRHARWGRIAHQRSVEEAGRIDIALRSAMPLRPALLRAQPCGLDLRPEADSRALARAPRPQLLLELLHRHRERRLRDEAGFGGVPEVAPRATATM